MPRKVPITQVQVRLPRPLANQLKKEAEKRDVSLNLLVTKAIERYLIGLTPIPDLTDATLPGYGDKDD